MINTEFDYIKVKLASPFRILKWSSRKLPNGQFIGEVKKSDTINYRTFRPEMNGLFCERIFGPSRSLQCGCEKYRQINYKGLICERCGVELTESRVRRHRMGYIKLIYPVVHVWYINSRPNFMALILEVESHEKTLDTTYTERFLKVKKYLRSIRTRIKCNNKEFDCNNLRLTPSKLMNIWDERIKRIKLASIAYFVAENEISFYGLHWDLQQYRKSRKLGQSLYPLKPEPRPQKQWESIPKYLLQLTPSFLVGTPVIRKELEKLNLKLEIFKTRCFIIVCTKVLNKEKPVYNKLEWSRKWEQQRIHKMREQAIKRIRILENLIGTGSSPLWMILTILPIIPPALRPMIQLEGGQFATSDLNELYRRIITRNNRLLRLLEIDAPQLIIRNEKRLLQEAVDTLIDNGRRGKIALSANNRPLKSLSEIIKGKQGRFRQNLLGKRVDYSGRSVIVVGPSLKLNQCGLPYEMVIELFQPFIIKELVDQGLAINIKIAKSLIRKVRSVIELVVIKILKQHPIFLNRAPTLHRLGVQAFEPILVQGKAIKLHPLVCSGFNADFDGDQMAVHVPLSSEAQAECYMLMLAPHNFLSPANGEPIIVPSQDMVLGCYYLTVNNMKGLLGSNHYFACLDDVMLAYYQNKIEIHATVWVRKKKDKFPLPSPIRRVILQDKTVIEYYQDYQIRKTEKQEIIVYYLKTTTGRIIFNYTIKKILNLL